MRLTARCGHRRRDRVVAYFAFLAAFVMVSSAPVASLNVLLFTARAAGPGVNAAGNNTTAPLPPPQLPPAPDQANITPGTITYANSTLSPFSLAAFVQVNTTGDASTGFLVSTGYGTFSVSPKTPYIVALSYNGSAFPDVLSGFTVITASGRVLFPSGKPALGSTPNGFYSSYLLGNKPGDGRMTVYYNFTSASNKVTAIFVPSTGKPSDYSVVWLAFTPLAAVTTTKLDESTATFAEITQDGWGISGGRVLQTSLGSLKEIGDYDGIATISSSPDANTAAVDAVLGYQDALAAYNGTFAIGNGTFAFGGVTGNVTGVVGNAKSFGTGQYVAVAPSSSQNLRNSFTISAWIYSTSIASGTTYEIVRTIAYTPIRGYFLRIVGDGTNVGHLDAEIFNAGSQSTWVSNNGIIGINTWYHVVFTLAPGGAGQFYVGGASVTTARQVYNTDSPGSTGSTLYIGCGDGAFEWFFGYIDEVQVLSAALTSTQLTALYNGYVAGPLPYDSTHMSRTYFNGLGQATKTASMDLYGNAVIRSANLAWNGQPAQSTLSNGYYYVYTYTFLGAVSLRASPVGPYTPFPTFDFGAEFYPTSLKTETMDGPADHHLSYATSDLLGRTSQTGAYNSASSNFNTTTTAYNAASLITSATLAIGGANTATTSFFYNAVGLKVYTIFPDGTNNIQSYDRDLRPRTATDAMGRTLANLYLNTEGSMNWISGTNIRTNASSTVCYGTQYTYNGVGQILSAKNGTMTCGSVTPTATDWTTTYTYDPLYRLQTESTNPSTVTMTYGYDAASHVTSIQYGSDGTVNYGYDTLGRVSTLSLGSTQYAQVYYYYERVGTIWYTQTTGDAGTLWDVDYTYDNAERAVQVQLYQHLKRGSGPTMKLAYTKDPAGYITSLSDMMGESTPPTDTYYYDSLGRLVYEYGPNSALPLSSGQNQLVTQKYTYGAFGNVASRYDSDFYNAYGYNYAYTDNAWGQMATYAFSSPSYHPSGSCTNQWNHVLAYNPDGSATSDTNTTRNAACGVASTATTSYVWDFNQRLAKVTMPSGAASTYLYDASGRQVREVDSSPARTLTFAYIGSSMAYEYDVTNSRMVSMFVYLNGQVFMRLDYGSSAVHYYDYDLSSNVRYVWSGSTLMTIEGRSRYKAYGTMATPLTALPQNTQVFGFADTEMSTAGYHMGAREYHPDQGRFLARDAAPGHTYTYAHDDSMSFRDPNGLASQGNMGGEEPFYFPGEEGIPLKGAFGLVATGAFSGVGEGVTLDYDLGLDAAGKVLDMSFRVGPSALEIPIEPAEAEAPLGGGSGLAGPSGRPGVPVPTNEGVAVKRGGIEPVLRGIEGERKVGITGPKEPIESITGEARYRVPDKIDWNERVMVEVKNAARIDPRSERQILDELLFARENDLTLHLVTRPSTALTPLIQDLTDSGEIVWIPML